MEMTTIGKKENITEDDRLGYFGVLPSGWIRYEAQKIEERTRAKKNIKWCVHRKLSEKSPLIVTSKHPI